MFFGDNKIEIEILGKNGSYKKHTIIIYRVKNTATLDHVTFDNQVRFNTNDILKDNQLKKVPFSKESIKVDYKISDNNKHKNFQVVTNNGELKDGVWNLKPGKNTLEFAFETENGKLVNYKFTIERESLSSDSSLEKVKIDTGFIFAESFDNNNVLNYQDRYFKTGQEIMFEAFKKHPNATVDITPKLVNNKVKLVHGVNTFNIKVTAQAKTTFTDYTVNVTAKATGNDIFDMKTLGFEDTLKFDPLVTQYELNVPYSLKKLEFKFELSEYAVEYIYNNDLKTKITTVEVCAKSEFGEYGKKYYITVYKEDPKSDEAKLIKLELDSSILRDFTAGEIRNIGEVSNTKLNFGVHATPSPRANVVLSANNNKFNEGVWTLDVGENILTIKVTSESGKYSNIYKIKVTRQDLANENRLDHVTLNDFTIKADNFSEHNEYRFTGKDFTFKKEVKIKIVPRHSSASTEITSENNNSVIILNYGENMIEFAVVAQNGDKNIFKVFIDAKSVDNEVLNIVVPGFEDKLVFDSATKFYTFKVDYSVENIMINVEVSDYASKKNYW